MGYKNKEDYNTYMRNYWINNPEKHIIHKHLMKINKRKLYKDDKVRAKILEYQRNYYYSIKAI